VFVSFLALEEKFFPPQKESMEPAQGTVVQGMPMGDCGSLVKN
jgi:hypothetical protein